MESASTTLEKLVLRSRSQEEGEREKREKADSVKLQYSILSTALNQMANVMDNGKVVYHLGMVMKVLHDDKVLAYAFNPDEEAERRKHGGESITR